MIGFVQAVLIVRCMRHMYMCRGRRTSAGRQGFKGVLPRLRDLVLHAPARNLLPGKTFWTGYKAASRRRLPWVYGQVVQVCSSLNACRCLRWKPWRLGAANFTDGCRRRRRGPQSMSWPYTADKVRGEPFCFKVAALDRWDAPLVAARAMRRPQSLVCVCMLCILNAVSFNRFSAYIVETQETHRHR